MAGGVPIKNIKGLGRFIANLRKEREAIPRRIGQGLKKAGLYLQAQSQKMVPVDEGNLKASAFTRSHGSGRNTVVAVGYTASYAVYVHEAVAMKLEGRKRPARGKKKGRGRYWDPQGRASAKFLEKPFRDRKNQQTMMRIIKKTAQGKVKL